MKTLLQVASLVPVSSFLYNTVVGEPDIAAQHNTSYQARQLLLPARSRPYEFPPFLEPDDFYLTPGRSSVPGQINRRMMISHSSTPTIP
ncbi:hypothetical protein QBC33DRAFT_544585 [Phialemonium atrogriseum]|uniref:Uncharacterized protein n=1 Tax=Phialemonium atrogriseum TaxID=1093897 RepID=A0AAJ0BW28_9PEZI|nr:uncharacterized protein QBC33DRAFT_544585 [Phialemonium atrogriseum]KAK1765530.1 hypothetical protein QBC33DRAFT_544585 [Phialemonium atrogriseum]